jgi:hypothetical protein
LHQVVVLLLYVLFQRDHSYQSLFITTKS